ncbi:hypothetical protein [Streptomyces sp. NPDC050264]|uniref:hypothetical protein n=1 Tax=Streptomyces sp. NPDC050264 TaxID=3155038 RepID=UPI0034495F09
MRRTGTAALRATISERPKGAGRTVREGAPGPAGPGLGGSVRVRVAEDGPVACVRDA